MSRMLTSSYLVPIFTIISFSLIESIIYAMKVTDYNAT
jgi:hypothetical protein